MRKETKIIAGLLLVIFALIVYIIMRAPDVVVEPFDEKPLRDEIARRDTAIAYWSKKAKDHYWQSVMLQNRADSLEETKVVIKHHYHEIYRDIPTASNQQLDSIIRTNW